MTNDGGRRHPGLPQLWDPVDPAGPAIAVAGANGFDGNAFIPFVEQAETLGPEE